MDHDARIELARLFSKEARSRFEGHLKEIILFGSVPRGDDDRYSDIDILVVLSDNDTALQRDISFLSFDLGLEYGEHLSVQTVTFEQFDRFHDFSFFQNIREDGIKIG